MKSIIVAVALVLLASSASALPRHQAKKINTDVLSCTTACTAAQCKLQKCDLEVPYACVGGTASGGCTNSPSYFDNTTACTACCDVSSCAISCTSCTTEQCASDPCSAKAPYMCTNGSDANGCAPTSSTWSINPGCSACCDTSTCPDTTPAPAVPTSVPGFSNCSVSCGDECHSMERCPFSHPYMCTAGKATNGCSKTASTWDGAQCSSCCDVKTCPQTPCGACGASVCNSTQCSLTNPYQCTGGMLSGGCSPSKSYFPQSADCSSCCDVTSCT